MRIAVLISHICVCMSYVIFEVCDRFACRLLCICVCECVCVCLGPGECNGPWRQASIHQRAAGISALPEYRWTTGAGRRAPPSSHRAGYVCVCVQGCYRHTKCSRYIHIYILYM